MRGCIIFAYLILFWNNVYVSKGWENLSLLPQYKGQASLEPYFSGYNAPPGGAVDGYLQEERGQGTCSITWANSKIKKAWWKFPLKSMANVAYLEIYFRKSTINRHVGFSVFVFNNSSYTPPLKPSEHKVFTHNIATCPNPVMNVTVNRETGGIALYNSKNPPVSTACSGYEPTFATIEICEVKVMGCPSQHYGESCVPCNSKCRDKQCDAFNGSCIYGCRETVIDSPDCSDCRDGYYGTDCTQSCGFCKIDTFCDKSTGICPEGCQGNWDHSHCAECEAGFYGQKCENTCGSCRNGTYCNATNGVCPDGCENHWDGPMCNVCPGGFYGSYCEFNCSKCKRGTFCDNVTGVCPEGCQDHWNGSMCDACKEGFYGQTCSDTCGHCINETYCNITNGECSSGCDNYWDTPMCQECKNGYYGLECGDKCGHCINGTYCDKVNGTCLDGCHGHWNGSQCNVCEDGYFGTKCEDRCGNCLKGSCEQGSGHCLGGCNQGWAGAECQAFMLSTDPNTGGIVGGLLTAFAVFALVVIIVIRILRRQIEQKEQGERQKLSTGVEYNQKCSLEEKGYVNLGHLSVASPDDVLQNSVSNGEYYNTSQVCTFIHVQELYNIIATKSREKNRDFQLEYKRLPLADESKCLTAKKKENVTKNRFKTTFPYEHSRVVLQEKWEENDNDYINANYIKDYKRERRYIGAQGPRNNTLADFIRMIWQENIVCIIMLTCIVENGKNKCAKYWPDKGKSVNIGKCTLSHLEETIYAFYTVRMFSFQRKDSNDIRIITQFHYTAWPDHGTPEEIGLVQFHRAVTKRYEPGAPLLVHCSAGVGRTGTFIGLDSLLRQGREKEWINVFEFVKQMREDRMSMVQTLEQYVFLHRALLCGFQERDSIISEYDIVTKASSLLNDRAPLNQQQLYKYFKFLETIKPVYEDECKEEARNEENRSKNVDIDIIPVSKYRPFLWSFVEGRNEYINAVIVPSYTAPSGLILTQNPLPDTEVDLWRLCMDHRVGAMIILNDNDEDISWLPSRGENRLLAPYLITARKTGTDIGGISQSSLLILRDGDTQSITVFKVDSRNDDQVIKLAEMVLEKERESNLTSLIISKDGAGPAGVFCVLYNALQQLRMDGEVDIFTRVRQIQTRRPEVINKLEDYRKCYTLVSKSVSTNGTYANM